MFHAGEFFGTSEGLTFYMKSPLFYWRNLDASEILSCFIKEIEMLRDRLRDDKASNGRLLNSLHSMAAQGTGPLPSPGSILSRGRRLEHILRRR
jgi:hypothetical protein